MTKTKQPKPVKAWAIVRNGELVSRWMFKSRVAARRWLVFKEDDEHIVRVEIKVLK